MRKLLMFVALVLGMVSCQNYLDDFDVNIGGEKEVVVSVSLPEGTRANSAVGAISNDVVLSDEYTLRYIFQIWDEAKQQKKDAVVEYSDDTKVSFPVRLVPGRNYRFVVWTDVVREDKKEDLHYNTANFPTISVNTDSWVAMDETRDAYTTSELITDFGSAQNYTLTLKRPFAKLRVITTDMDELMGVVPTTATVTYTTEHYNTFNALENKAVRESKNQNKEHKDYTIKEYELTNGKVLFTDYFFAENDAVSFNLSVNFSDGGEPITRNFNTDIPVNRNHLTTLIGNILTKGDNIEVRIEEGFAGKSDFPYYAGLEPASNEIWYTSTDGKVVTPNKTNVFGANIVSNSYDVNKECWVIKFDGDVTKIGSDAFEKCSNLESIIIPDSVTSIGIWAFMMCHNLTSVTIPDSLTTFGDYIFLGCDNLQEFKGKYASGDGRCWIVDGVIIYFAPAGLTEYTIPNNATKIRTTAFSFCDSLTSVTIPESVTSIGASAFYSCDGLTSVTIPESVTTIETSAFCNCSSLQEFKGKFASEDGRCLIVGGVLNSFAIGCGATEYTIPDSVTTIGNAAFEYCSSLTSVTIPNSVTTIRGSAFSVCSSLTSVTIPDSVTTIGSSAFSNCYSLESVTIGENVTYIGVCAFQLCKSLTSVYCKATTPPVGVTSMFISHASGRKIYVPMESVEAYKSAEGWSEYADDIVAYNFETGEVASEPANNEIWYTSTDGSVVNPRSNTDFGANIISNTYYGGRGIITFDGDVTKIGDHAFSGSYPSIKSVILPKTVTEIGQSAFQFNYALEDINLPEGITSIGVAAFFDCNSLTSITIPDSVVSIGDLVFAGTNINSFSGKGACDNGKCLVFGDELYAFATGCDATNYTIPAGVKTIKWGAFAYSTIESIDFKNTDVTTIEQYAFAYCDNLRSVTIPMGITSIGESAFTGCDNLKEVYFKSNTPIVGTPYMFGDPTKVTIYVPGPVVDSYKNAEGWEEYKDVIVGYQPNNQIWYTSTTDNVINPSYTNGYVANIISNTYENGIGVIVFDDDIYAIGYNTFFNNNQLLSITIPNSVTTIEYSAFQMCNNLQEVIIPNSVTKIMNGAFSTCSSLTHIELPQNLSTIGTYVFQAAGITEITIPSSVTYIGECALDCNVKNIYCKSTTPPEMGGELCQHIRHNGCSKKIYVPTESVDAYKSAEGWSSYADAIEGYSF